MVGVLSNGELWGNLAYWSLALLSNGVALDGALPWATADTHAAGLDKKGPAKLKPALWTGLMACAVINVRIVPHREVESAGAGDMYICRPQTPPRHYQQMRPLGINTMGGGFLHTSL